MGEGLSRAARSWLNSPASTHAYVRSFTSVSKVSSGLFGAFDKHEKTVYKDDHGNVFYDKRDKEIDFFIEKMILTNR
jgi:hypothetical protein